MWVKKRKEEKGAVERGKKKTSVWDDVRVCAWTCTCVLSVRMRAEDQEVSGGHAQFQLGSFQSVQTHLGSTEVKGRLKQALRTQSKPFPRKVVKCCPQFVRCWDILRSHETNLSSCDKHAFQIRNFTKAPTDLPTHIKMCVCAHTCNHMHA